MSPKILKLGDSGPDVGLLQKALNENGASLTVDDDFGAKTDAALRAFQAAKGLVIDGKAGVLTQAALASAVQPPIPAGKCKILDTSRWEKDMDYSKTWAGTDYAGNIAKATQGADIADAYLNFHERGTKGAGKGFGTFHFMDYLVSGATQARWYFAHAKGKSGLWCSDVEWANKKKTLGEDGAQIVQDFLEEISQLTGKLPWIYTNRYFFVGFDRPERFAKYPCWLNDFSVRPPAVPKAPAPWTSLIAHQYQYAPEQNQDDVEPVPGAGKIDVSWYYGTKEDFAKECAL